MKTTYTKPVANVYNINSSGFIASGGGCQPFNDIRHVIGTNNFSSQGTDYDYYPPKDILYCLGGYVGSSQ